MPAFPARRLHPATALSGALFAVFAAALPVCAQGSLSAHYTISMTGISVGQLSWMVEIGDELYTTSASGKASGVVSVLVKGEGSVETRGAVVDGHLMPTRFNSHINDDEGTTELQMTFADGVARERIAQGPPPTPDRLPISDAARRGVSDPLTAVLIPAKAGDDVLAPAACDRVLMIFDGRRRYDLALSYKRRDKFASDSGYSGPVLVCGVILRPIAGYRPDSLLVKYVAGRRDMELWFAPIAGTSIMAPILVSMPTLVGTLKLRADRFQSPAPPPVPTTPDAAAR